MSNRTLKAKASVAAATRAAAIDREWLQLFVDFAQGDPHLTAWEEGFVASMRHYCNLTGPYQNFTRDWRLSHKQLNICHQIEDKLLAIEAGQLNDQGEDED